MRQRVFFGYNAAEAMGVQGYIDGLSKTVTTKKYLNRAAGYTHDILKAEFELALDKMALMAPDLFKHVYEWGPDYESRYSLVGLRRARLWHLVSNQSGGSRTLSFVFLPSKVPVPVNPILLKPGGKKGRTVKEGVHIFVWKAKVMEYNLPVTIEPKLTEQLAFVGSKGKAMFTPKGYSFNPGAAAGTTGNFTSFYAAWWAVEAPRLFESKIRKKLERDVANDVNFAKVTRKFKTRAKNISIGTGDKASYRHGVRMAQLDLAENERDYIGEAAQRRYELYGDSED